MGSVVGRADSIPRTDCGDWPPAFSSCTLVCGPALMLIPAFGGIGCELPTEIPYEALELVRLPGACPALPS
ncbi:hypothetical protein MMUR_40090 [Mycolicibacterium murale]|uniref:Uncharacterized protein n=1 Tax=Mycolicibacterium murale TaxID=182220 RepID=A0A7I9WQG9_9MYCO|nr:hypothetical protein MMUR_40090 [Mycolicibacterium murale]